MGNNVFDRNHLVGGNINAAPNKPMAAVPRAAEVIPGHKSLSVYANVGG